MMKITAMLKGIRINGEAPDIDEQTIKETRKIRIRTPKNRRQYINVFSSVGDPVR